MSTTQTEGPTIEAKIIEVVVTDTLSLLGRGYELIVPAKAAARKASLIAAASEIVSVSTPSEAEAAQGEIKQLVKIRNEVDRDRLAVKSPVKQFVDVRIDGVAKTFMAELVEAEARLRKLVSDYAAKVESDRQAAERERIRLENLRAQEQRKADLAREAEDRRLVELEKAKAAIEAEAERIRNLPPVIEETEEENDARMFAEEQARQEVKRLDDEAKAERARFEIAAEERRKEQERAAAERGRAEIASRQSLKGVSSVIEFEVEDVAALHAHNPSLVTLTVRTIDVKAEIKRLTDAHGGVLPTIPGLRIFRVAKVGSR